MTCQSCESAKTNPHSGLYHAGCTECDCRALATSPEAWRATHGLTNAPLQDAMQRLAKGDRAQYEHIRKRVWHWIGVMNDAK